MPRDPLVAIILLLFLLLIAVLLTLWLALTSTTRARRREVTNNPVTPRLAVSNDQVRGAKATKPPENKQEDAFDRFLKAKNDDLDF